MVGVRPVPALRAPVRAVSFEMTVIGLLTLTLRLQNENARLPWRAGEAAREAGQGRSGAGYASGREVRRAAIAAAASAERDGEIRRGEASTSQAGQYQHCSTSFHASGLPHLPQSVKLVASFRRGAVDAAASTGKASQWEIAAPARRERSYC